MEDITKTDRQIAYVNGLKGADMAKEYEQQYLKALRDIAEVMFDMTDEDFENNCPTHNTDD